MKKNFLLFFLAFSFAIVGATAQTSQCGTDEVYRQQLKNHPEIAQLRESFNKQVREGLKNVDLRTAKRTTDGDGNFWYDIPFVVHIIHDYGTDENLSDETIFNDLNDPINGWNATYAGANQDTASVIAPFKKWIGNPHIRLHLATKDPFGNPTIGITRHRSYLTYSGSDQSKLDDWPNSSYLNIWFVHDLAAQGNFQPAAYAYFPETGTAQPYYDGVISFADYAQNANSGGTAYSKTINHEVGHYFSLYHPWNSSEQGAGSACGDDEVDDTPPTKGHDGGSCTPGALYDTSCAGNYFVIYSSTINPSVDSLVDYPDTTNAQNIMDYTYCSRMFTIGQTVRMHKALNNNLGFRNNLWDSANLINTGVWAAPGVFAARPDLQPIPEFNATEPIGNPSMKYFVTPDTFPGSGTQIVLTDESWNDTIKSAKWHFSNGSEVTDTTFLAGGFHFTKTFAQPGWVDITLTAHANNTPDSSRLFSKAIFVAAKKGADATTYVGEFSPSGDLNSWPTFNYYNNEFYWQPCSSAGFYDNYSMMYKGYDTRLVVDPLYGFITAYPKIGMPKGDYDDMFSVPFDLSAYDTGACNLNFYYSGATRTNFGANQNDSLVISYSTDYAKSWHRLAAMSKNTLCNKGQVNAPYVPLWQGDWAPMTIPVPSKVRTSYALFKFTYYPGICSSCPYDIIGSTGNNFYIDRINFSRYTADVATPLADAGQITVAPNPTAGNAYVILNGNFNTSANIMVTDVTGKLVYTTTQQINAGEVRIEIPQSAIATKGVYLVQTVTGSVSNTQKLVVY
jgi:Pregnancy-associated plasma protein-A/Secretion system C-terminal sorting domain